MALLLDTSTVAPRTLGVELHSAFCAAGGTAAARLIPAHTTVFRSRIHGWDMGGGTRLMRLSGDPLIIASSAGRIAQYPTERITLMRSGSGTWTHTQHGVTSHAVTGQPTLLVVDQSVPFELRMSTPVDLIAVHIDTARMNLMPATIASAIRHLRPTNAFYHLMTSYLHELHGVAEATPAMLPELNAATVALARGLLDSVIDDSRTPGRAAHPAAGLLAQIEGFIDTNLTDPTLSADTIAAAHNISPRALYKTWSATGTRLQEHIIRLRLERSRSTLASRGDLSIAEIAHANGFADPTHFTRRFGQAFGVSPSVWRRGANRSAD